MVQFLIDSSWWRQSLPGRRRLLIPGMHMDWQPNNLASCSSTHLFITLLRSNYSIFPRPLQHFGTFLLFAFFFLLLFFFFFLPLAFSLFEMKMLQFDHLNRWQSTSLGIPLSVVPSYVFYHQTPCSCGSTGYTGTFCDVCEEIFHLLLLFLFPFPFSHIKIPSPQISMIVHQILAWMVEPVWMEIMISNAIAQRDTLERIAIQVGKQKNTSKAEKKNTTNTTLFLFLVCY